MMMPVPEGVPSLNRIKPNIHIYHEMLKKVGGLSCKLIQWRNAEKYPDLQEPGRKQ